MYAGILTVVVALILTAIGGALEPLQSQNALDYKKKDILTSVGQGEVEDVPAAYEKAVTAYVINADGEVVEGKNALSVDLKAESKKPEAERLMPVFIYDNPENNEKSYVLAVRGMGLWDEIWGYIALNSNFNTIEGTVFDHTGETPGLGAEIAADPFETAFVGKSLFDKSGEFVSVEVKKGAKGEHQVQAISGSTMTCNGVTDMLKQDLGAYLPYINKMKKG